VTETWERIRAEHQLKKYEAEKECRIEMLFQVIAENAKLRKELNAIRYKLAQYEGREMMRGGREDMIK